MSKSKSCILESSVPKMPPAPVLKCRPPPPSLLQRSLELSSVPQGSNILQNNTASLSTGVTQSSQTQPCASLSQTNHSLLLPTLQPHESLHGSQGPLFNSLQVTVAQAYFSLYISDDSQDSESDGDGEEHGNNHLDFY